MSFATALRRTLQSAGISWLIAANGVSAADAEALADLARKTHYHGIAFARTGSADLLLASHHGLFAVDRDGTAALVSPVQDFMGFSPDPANPLGYFASGHPAAGGNSGFLYSADGGATWKQLSEGVNGPVDFHQLDSSPLDPKTIYGAYGKIQVSRDGGSTWAIAGDPPPDMIALAASSLKRERVYGASERGLYVSENGGAAWTLAAFGGEVVSMVESVPGNVVYAFVLGRGLVKLDESDLSRQVTLSNDFGEAIPLHFAAHETQTGRLVLTTQNNDVLESIDAGATWRPFASPAE
jgi:photosystem II stability/assembly factor-like uncharacterized protein